MIGLKEYYNTVIVPEFLEKKYSRNILDVPRLLKIVINIGFNASKISKKDIDASVNELSLIAGQRAVITKAKKSIAGFKIRDGYDVGCKVTLRKQTMYNFLDKLLFLVLPRIRDFKGLSLRSFDGKGNYSLGIKEQIVFPEISYDKVDIIRGMDISIVTNALTDEKGKLLLKSFKFPFN